MLYLWACLQVYHHCTYTIHSRVCIDMVHYVAFQTAQYGFILYQDQGSDGGEESIFFHMNSLTGGSDFSDLRPGDEVEFLITFSQRTNKNSAIHVKKLR